MLEGNPNRILKKGCVNCVNAGTINSCNHRSRYDDTVHCLIGARVGTVPGTVYDDMLCIKALMPAITIF